MIKFVGIAAFNSYYGCQKCCVRGKMLNRTMSFPQTDAQKRTNDSFRKRLQKEHHQEFRSVIEALDIDMVNDFPTSDPLHLLELGMMKRCLTRWKEGTKTYKKHFKPADLNKINSLLMHAKGEMPTEIHRAIRDLNTLHFWKGTEYRTFLMYIGIIVLQSVLHEEEYEHFRLLYCVVIICSSNAYESIVHRSTVLDNLITDYLEGYIDIYGENSITSNVHNLCHLLDDVRRFGSLNTISTYPFENCLQMIKSKIRSANNPLQQIGRRFSEIASTLAPIDFDFHKNRSIMELKYPLLNDKTKFQTVCFKDFCISSRKIGDQWFMSETKSLIMFKYAKKIKEKTILYGYEIMEKEDFFKIPFDSSKLNIYISDIAQLVEANCDSREVKCKMVGISFQNKMVFQPLLHTLH